MMSESEDMKKTSSSSAEGKREGRGKIALPITPLVRRGLRERNTQNTRFSTHDIEITLVKFHELLKSRSKDMRRF